MKQDWNELSEQLEERRRQGETIVTTNGVFDILHIGHIRYLQEARACGSLLVVGVNSDRSTRELKGPTRPLTPELERMEMLAELRCVDYVTLFDERTPLRLLQTLRPDIHVKGGDYRAEDLPETAVIEANGGHIRIIPFVANHSTSGIVARIQANAEPIIPMDAGTGHVEMEEVV